MRTLEESFCSATDYIVMTDDGILFQYHSRCIFQQTHFKDDEGGLPTTIEGLSESEEEEDGEVDLLGNEETEDEDVAGYSVENAFLEEKEDTCVALRELSLHCG